MASMMTEYGDTGLKRWGGIIEDDFLREWRGIEAYKRADEMRLNSPVVGALLLAIEQSVKAVDWQEQSEAGENDPRLELLRESISNLETSFEDHVSEALGFLAFGYSLFEICYQRTGYKILWKKFAPRSQDTVIEWGFDDNGRVISFTQQAPPKYQSVTIPMSKVIHYRAKTEKGNPEGRSILRPAWKPYYYSKNIEQIEGIGVERDLAGLPVITLPETPSDNDIEKAKEFVRRIRRDEQDGLVIPAGWVFELASTGGSRQFDTDKIITRYNSQILMSCLAQFLMLGQQSTGSYALSKDQTDLFVMSVNTIADIITDTINKQAIPTLMRLNGYDPHGVYLEHTPAGDIDVNSLADTLQKMGNKITWTTKDEVFTRSVLRLPELTPEEIDEEKQDAQERQAQIQQAYLQRNTQPQNDKDDMSAAMMQAGIENDINDPERLRMERELTTSLTGYFKGLGSRLKKGAKEIKKNAA